VQMVSSAKRAPRIPTRNREAGLPDLFIGDCTPSDTPLDTDMDMWLFTGQAPGSTGPGWVARLAVNEREVQVQVITSGRGVPVISQSAHAR
jgi:hypothetical protein